MIRKSLKNALILIAGLSMTAAEAQTNVYDNVIAVSPVHTSLKAAVDKAGLASVLKSADSNYTVFAPDNAAFDQLAKDLKTDIAGLLALPNLADILLYHVLGTEAKAADVTNGALVNPLGGTNSIKLTKSKDGMSIHANQALVNRADVDVDNGVVHSLNSVLLAGETVVDIALDNGFTSLAAAVIEARLLPALTDPFGIVTVFAPTNKAFDDFASANKLTIAELLALPTLADVLTYHVVSGSVKAADLTNGNVTTLNGKDVLVNLAMGVRINSATVTKADLTASNGVVHVIDEVLDEKFLSSKTLNAQVISIYPNPSSSVVNIALNSSSPYYITDMTGRAVRSGVLSENTSIDISGLTNGTYVLNINEADAKYVATFIKN